MSAHSGVLRFGTALGCPAWTEDPDSAPFSPVLFYGLIRKKNCLFIYIEYTEIEYIWNYR